MWQKIKKWLSGIFNVNDTQVDFIGGGEALPAPLDPEEEKALVTRYMQGRAVCKKYAYRTQFAPCGLYSKEI